MDIQVIPVYRVVENSLILAQHVSVKITNVVNEDGRELKDALVNLNQRGGGEVSSRKLVIQSAYQYDVTSRVSDFQNGEQSVYRRPRVCTLAAACSTLSLWL